ncbi:MAG TPA: hypothetical protein V6C58_02440 [Allocoleopsis sp.]
MVNCDIDGTFIRGRFVKNCYKSKLTAFFPNLAAIDILEVQKLGEKL